MSGLAGMTSPLFQGGLSLMLIGGGLAMLRSVPMKLWRVTQSKLFLECTLRSDDMFYYWVAQWLATRPEMQRTGTLNVHTTFIDAGAGSSSRQVSMGPGDGEHLLTIDGAKVWLTVSTEHDTTGIRRTLRFRTLKRNRQVIVSIMDQAAELERKPTPGKTKVFVAQGTYWSLHSTKNSRPPESIVLTPAVRDRLLGDMQLFVGSKDHYQQLGVPYRRGYLLSGAPGNGKSSMAAVCAAVLERPLYVLMLGDAEMDDSRLMTLLGSVPEHALVVVEDVDTVFSGRERKTENSLTLSGLLNAIDGPLATDGRILIMTTNHPELLDPALIRPGRVDIHVVLGNATPEQAREIFLRFFPDETAGAAEFEVWAGDGSHSMAELQTHLLEHIHSSENAKAPPIGGAFCY